MAQQAYTEDGQSYQRFPVSLISNTTNRAGNVLTKDDDFQNILFEIVKDKQTQDDRKYVLKRSGTASLIASVAAAEVRGQFYWEDTGKFLYCVDRNVYVYNVSTGVNTTLTNVFTSGSSEVGFTEYLYDNNTVVVIATDGTTLVQIDSANTVTPCADPDMPAHLPYPVFIDGYLLVVKTNTADIYNSDLNNPLSWTAGDFISAEMSPDLLRRITKVNNYVLALGSESVEYFWDAGNSSGSPLSRNDSPIKINTYISGLSQYGNDLYYIGKSAGGQPGVFFLKDFKLEELSTPTITRYLSLVADNTSTWRTNIISMQGHVVLFVTAGTRTFAYDIDEKLWSRMSYQGTDTFNIKYSTRISTNLTSYTVFSFQGTGLSTIYKFDDTLMQDSAIDYPTQVVTEKYNFGDLNRKSMPRFTLVADRTPVDSNIELYWTDNDYQSYSGPRTINLNQDSQSCKNLGSFRQRAFKLRYTGPYIMRLQYAEVDINKGIS